MERRLKRNNTVELLHDTVGFMTAELADVEDSLHGLSDCIAEMQTFVFWKVMEYKDMRSNFWKISAVRPKSYSLYVYSTWKYPSKEYFSLPRILTHVITPLDYCGFFLSANPALVP